MADIDDKYEQQHLKNIIAANKRIQKIFEDSIQQIVYSAVSLPWNGKVISLSAFPALKKKVDQVLKKMHAGIYTTIVNGIETSWDLSNKKNKLLIDHRLAGKRLKKNANAVYYNPNKEALEKFIHRTEKGMNLSDRVWKTLDPFKTQLEGSLGLGIGEGKPAAEIAKETKQYLNEPDRLFRRVRDSENKLQLSKAAKNYHPGRGIYRSSFKNALRLTRTENNIAYRTADHERWANLPFVIGIQIKLSRNHPRFDMCDPLAGEYPKDFKFTGWHPNCLCYQVPKMMSDEEYDQIENQILAGDPISIKTEGTIWKTPSSFNNWVKENQDRIEKWKNKPYWIRDNEKYYSPKAPKTHKLPVDIKKLKPTIDDYVHKIEGPKYRRVLNELTKYEKASIYGYTDTEYYSLNGYLRGLNVSQSKQDYFDNYRNLMNNALEAVPEKYVGVAYRGTNLRQEQLEAYKDAFKNKGEIIEHAFTSTSSDVTRQFGGRVKFIIHSKNGKEVAALSEHDHEKEVIFKAGTKFKVLKIRADQNGIHYITLEEVD